MKRPLSPALRFAYIDFPSSCCCSFQLKLTRSQNESLRKIIAETIARVQSNMISMLLFGACGKSSYAALGDAAHLAHSLLCCGMLRSQELRANIVDALKTEQFRMGENAREVIVNVLEGIVKGEVSVDGLKFMFEQMWELHQLDEIESLETTDVVARFAKRFRK